MLIDAHAHFDTYGDRLEAALGEVEEHDILTLSCSMDPATPV